MIISLIAAASTNNVIGKDNGLPWSLPNDMKYFKNTTWGMPLIMGRKTFESMKNEPLPGRVNIVITSKKDYQSPGAVIVSSLAEAIDAAKDADSNEVFVIGGGEIFKDAIEIADRIYMTRVRANVDGDIFFPIIDSSKFKIISKRDCAADEKHKYSYTFELWEKV